MSETQLSRPMDMGAIFDGAFSLYRRYFVTIVGAVGVIAVPVALLEIAAGPAGFLISFIAGLVTPAVGALIARDAASGVTPTIGGVWRRMGRLIVPLLVTAILVFLTAIVGAIFFIIPGVLFGVWFSLSAQAIAIDDRRYFSAMGRSRELVRGSWWRVFGILLLASIMVGIASGLVESFVTGVLALVGVGHGLTFTSTPTTNTDVVPAAIGSGVGALLVSPVGALIYALLFFDLRLRKDGTDIAAAIDVLEQ
jgi:hypothetical protein